MSARRDVSFIIQKLRDFLLLRKNVNFQRFRDDMAARTQDPPNLPEGPNAKLGSNYYYTRDARRLVKPNDILVEANTMKQLPEGGEKPATTVKRVPGRVYNWDM